MARLTDFDFESVCKDLFESELDMRLEIFTRGPDRGIDLRHLAPGSSGELVIQCKNWEKHKRTQLIGYMRSVELPKIRKLRPKRYILATSVGLTVDSKAALAEILAPYLLTPGDIYGLHEIESLLRARPELVSRHLRLWLSSAQVLQSLLNKRVITRSSDLADDVKRSMLVYVPNAGYTRAREILETAHVCVISGIPGIGKTTLARVLAGTYAASSYQVYEISEDADEINGLWDDNVPQFFYYDDFLGQNTLNDKLHKNEDSRLVRILHKVNRFPNKRLVMTTREYILEQARQQYERIDREDFSPWMCVLRIGDYAPLIRAEILYNHIYYSELSRSDKALFAEPSTYKRIIDHKHFNPRLIDYSIRVSSAENRHGQTVLQKVIESLDDPSSLWDHIVSNQLDAVSVDLLISTFFLKRPAETDLVRGSLARYRSRKGDRLSDKQFRKSVKVLEGTMMRVSRYDGVPVLDYHNPSVADYIRLYIFGQEGVLLSLVESVGSFKEIENIWLQRIWPDAIQALRQSNVREALSDAIVRTYQHDEAGCSLAPADIYANASMALAIAEKFRLSRVWEVIREWISSIDLDDDLPSPDDVATVIQQIAGSSCPKIRSLLHPLLEDGVDYITEDIGDWENARHASALLMTIGSVTPQAAIEHVESVLVELVNNAFENVVNDGWIIDLDYLQEMVQYANLHSNSSELFPNLDVASAIIWHEVDGNRIADLDTPRIDPVRDNSENDAQIDRMLSALRDIGDEA